MADGEPADRVQDGGGLRAQGEHIEVIEMPLQESREGMADGRICDAKTNMLLQHVALFRNALL